MLLNFLNRLSSQERLCSNHGTKWCYLLTYSIPQTNGLSKKLICDSKKDLHSLTRPQHNKTREITSSKSHWLLPMKWMGGLMLTLNKNVHYASEKSRTCTVNNARPKVTARSTLHKQSCSSERAQEDTNLLCSEMRLFQGFFLYFIFFCLSEKQHISRWIPHTWSQP